MQLFCSYQLRRARGTVVLLFPAISVALIQRPGTPDRLLQHLQPRRLQGRLADLVREPVQVLLLVAAPEQAQAQSVSDAAVESRQKTFND